MRVRTRSAAIAVAAALAIGLTACVPDDVDRVVPGSALTVAQTTPVTSLNPAVIGQDTAADAGLAAATASGFWRRDASGERVAQERFGSIRVRSEQPLTVTYTVNADVHWSDGVAVDAADLLLAWAAGTTHRTGGAADDEGLPATRWGTGAGPGRGLDLVSQVPEIGDDGRSITLVYDSPVADWESAFDVLPVAAHGVVALGHPDEAGDPDAAKDALITAVQDDDLDWLAPVSRAFREDYVLDGDLPDEAAITNGAYLIEDAADGAHVALRANPDFRWGPSARIERLLVTAIPDAAARVAAVSSGEADIAAAPATADLVALGAEAGSAVGIGTSFEHLDLQTAGGGAFDPATYGGDEAAARAVRAAFLATVPRAALRAAFVPAAPARDSAVRPPAPAVPLEGAGDAETDTATPTDPSTPTATPGGTSTTAAEAAPDIAVATALLAEANAPNPTVRLLAPAGDPRRAAAFAEIAASAALAGITVVDVSRADWASALAAAPGEYDAALFAWDADPSAPVALAAGVDTAGARNVYGWSDETIDGLVARAATETDAAARRATLDDLDDAVAEQAWTLPLFDIPILTVWSAGVRDVPVAPTADGVLAGYAEWVPTTPVGTGSPTH
jgi:peptide/nickel transport system substrate-binding protein